MPAAATKKPAKTKRASKGKRTHARRLKQQAGKTSSGQA
jgi:hypothetical protein